MANFCKYCGRVLQDGEICSCPQAQAEAAAAHAQSQGSSGYYPPQQPPQQPPYQPPQQPQYAPPRPAYDPTDHTAEFDPKDISDNKVIAMLVYLPYVSIIGIFIALLASHSSAYVMFHVRQSLKFTVISVLMSYIVAILAVILIIPIIGWIAYIVIFGAYGVVSVILFVVQIICFVQVCGGKVKEPPIISSLGFLK